MLVLAAAAGAAVALAPAQPHLLQLRGARGKLAFRRSPATPHTTTLQFAAAASRSMAAAAQDCTQRSRAPAVSAMHRLRGGAVARSDLPLQITSLVFVLSLSLVTLTPAPFLVSKMGAARGMSLLTWLATTSAVGEIIISPSIGGLVDSIGRKPVLIGTLGSMLVVNAATAAFPSIPMIAASKFLSSLALGVFFLSAGAILADYHRTQPDKLAAASGILFAVVNGGFGLGVALSGFMPEGLRSRYVTSSLVSVACLVLAGLAVRESMPPSERVPFRIRSFDPFSGARLLRHGRRMQLLVALLALNFAPLFMGDTLQVFAIDRWSLSEPQVSRFFTFIAMSGVIANGASGLLIRHLGLRSFSMLAALSNLVFWFGCMSTHHVALICTAISILGTARALGATTMMTTEGARLGVPQGELAGERSNLIAWLKVIGPLAYGQLYVHGLAAGLPQLPFILNVFLIFIALVLTPIGLAPVVEQSQGSSKHG